jgi:hypothetical protein
MICQNRPGILDLFFFVVLQSGLNYIILHPGGLVDTPSGVEEYSLDVDDKLGSQKITTISRDDVAAMCVATLSVASGQNVSFDCITREVENGETPRSAEVALTTFLEQSKTANYAL